MVVRCRRNGSKPAASAPARSPASTSSSVITRRSPSSVALLRGRLVHHGITDLDAAAIRLTAPRAFTQEISRHVFDDSIDGARRWNGIAYLSKHGDDLENWAIFEPAAPNPIAVAHFDHLDEDLVNALRLHGLHMTTIPSGGQ